ELRQPAERLTDPLRGEERSPAPGHPDRGGEEERIGGEQIPPVARADEIDGLAEVDLPEQVGEDRRAHSKLERDPGGAADPHRVNAACTRRSASIASAMSASVCAGERGSESTSFP